MDVSRSRGTGPRIGRLTAYYLRSTLQSDQPQAVASVDPVAPERFRHSVMPARSSSSRARSSTSSSKSPCTRAASTILHAVGNGPTWQFASTMVGGAAGSAGQQAERQVEGPPAPLTPERPSMTTVPAVTVGGLLDARPESDRPAPRAAGRPARPGTAHHQPLHPEDRPRPGRVPRIPAARPHPASSATASCASSKACRRQRARSRSRSRFEHDVPCLLVTAGADDPAGSHRRSRARRTCRCCARRCRRPPRSASSPPCSRIASRIARSSTAC